MSMGFWQLLVILLIVLVVFGAGRLPKVMGDLGKGLRSFKEGLNGSATEKEDQSFLSSKDKDESKPKE